MSIGESAKATRRYVFWRSSDDFWSVGIDGIGNAVAQFRSPVEAQAACDRLNLLAVLEAIREPTERMVAAARRAGYGAEFCAPIEWRAMIDAAIKEVRKAGNDA